MTKIYGIALAATSLTIAFSSPARAEIIRQPVPEQLLTEHCTKDDPKKIVYLGAAEQGQPKFLQCSDKTIWWTKEPEKACGNIELLLILAPRTTGPVKKDLNVFEEVYERHCQKKPALGA